MAFEPTNIIINAMEPQKDGVKLGSTDSGYLLTFCLFTLIACHCCRQLHKLLWSKELIMVYITLTAFTSEVLELHN